MASSSDLVGQVALVTGGAVGIGRSNAKCLASAGADVALTWMSHEDEGRSVVQAIEGLGRHAVGFRLDATSSDDVNAGPGQGH